ncbi:ComF family protein [Parvularcula sp. ZS-1/3]|uniref:ComF family protein n=1 Tax=Parvularcula mediterranea TaxID=2732508 RepID=A0A7Y3RLT7_9PROT|nr:ComF family protein [Parvularcula mediterranea]NNU16360.1 ComF family protein [Parvularcula mediterranea]
MDHRGAVPLGLSAIWQRLSLRQALGRSKRLSEALLFPASCPLTGEPLADAGEFSAEGWAKLEHSSDRGCTLCGGPVPAERDGPLCGPCAAPDRYPRNLCGKGRLDRLRSGVVYGEAVAKLILELKYADRHDVAAPLAALLRQAVTELDPPKDAILVPVPLHPQRLRQRRYNQALVLARALGKRSGHLVEAEFLFRRKATPQQKGLGFDARFRNLTGAFEASDRAKGRNIVIVDDVLTSGATLVGCARALRRNGARSVMAVTVARVFPDSKDAQVELPEI